MTTEFPRNYVLHLELGSMYLDAKQPERALEVFRNALAKVEANEDRFGRMPERTKEAIVRKIEKVTEKLKEAASTITGADSALAEDLR